MAHAHPSPHSGGLLAIQRVEPFEHRGLALSCDAIDAEGRIGAIYSAYDEERAPGLSWNMTLEAASFVLVVEDPDAPGDKPFLHWLVWNIPGAAVGVPEGTPRTARPETLAGAVQGLNGAGSVGWHGPKPPEGHGPHRYHFQLFALSKTLDHLRPDTPLETLVSALKGLTIASGEVIGVFERADPIADAPSPGRTGGYGADPYAETQRDLATGRGGLDADDRDHHAPHDEAGEVRRA